MAGPGRPRLGQAQQASALSGRDVAASNATLEVFLGGRRKSWMPDPQDSSKTGPKPLTPFPSKPHKSRHTIPPSRATDAPNPPPPSTTTDVEQSPARTLSSNSTSPQLANLLTRVGRRTSETAPQTTMIPSPAASDEPLDDAPNPPSISTHNAQAPTVDRPPEEVNDNDVIITGSRSVMVPNFRPIANLSEATTQDTEHANKRRRVDNGEEPRARLEHVATGGDATSALQNSATTQTTPVVPPQPLGTASQTPRQNAGVQPAPVVPSQPRASPSLPMPPVVPSWPIVNISQRTDQHVQVARVVPSQPMVPSPRQANQTIQAAPSTRSQPMATSPQQAYQNTQAAPHFPPRPMAAFPQVFQPANPPTSGSLSAGVPPASSYYSHPLATALLPPSSTYPLAYIQQQQGLPQSPGIPDPSHFVPQTNTQAGYARQPQLQTTGGPGRQNSLPSGQAYPNGHLSGAQSPLPQLSCNWPPNLNSGECWLAIEKYKSAHQADPEIMHAQTGKQRLEVLSDAVKEEDFAYLVWHQLYCMLTLCPARLPDALRNHQGLKGAVWILNQVLSPNNLISADLLIFFVSFPAPLPELITKYSQHWGREVGAFANFARLAPNNYDSLKATCKERGFPPLVIEMQNYLHILSPVFQKLVFTSMRRNIWFRHEIPTGWTSRAEILFKKQQHEVRRRETENPQLRDHMVHYNLFRGVDIENYGERLRHLKWSHERWARDQAPSLSPGLVNRPSSTNGPGSGNAFPHPGSAIPSTSHSLGGTVVPRASTLTTLTAQPLGGAPSLSQPGVSPRPPTAAQQGPALRIAAVLSQPPQSRTARQSPLVAPLLPPAGTRLLQLSQPTPWRTALHQAGLQTPDLRVKEAYWKRYEPSRLYQFFDRLAVGPVPVYGGPSESMLAWTFDISDEEWDRIPRRCSPHTPGEFVYRVDNTSHLYRLRCVKHRPTDAPLDDAWAATNTAWIPYGTFFLNKVPLQQRRKGHYKKDLPIDITGMVQKGRNTLELAIIRRDHLPSQLHYQIGVELYAFQSDRDVQQALRDNRRRRTATQTRETMTARLNKTRSVGDEIAIVESTLTIPLFDPFSQSAIPKIPVRGTTCPHFECFDLENFLKTRPLKGQASDYDFWRCPFCNGDARPSSLIVDEFLIEVREELALRGLEGTRAIIFSADGTWQPKPEPVSTGVRSTSPDVDDGVSGAVGGDGSASGPVIIELD